MAESARAPSRGAKGDGVGIDAGDGGVEISRDLAVLDAVLDVGEDPVLDVGLHGGAAIDEGDARAVTPELEGGDGGGVLAADDDDVEAVVGMRVVVVVLDLGEVFAGDVHHVGQVVVAGGDDDFARGVAVLAAEVVAGADGEVEVLAGDGFDALVRADVELVVLGDLAVVLEGLIAGGLGVGLGKGMSPISSSSEVVKKVMWAG